MTLRVHRIDTGDISIHVEERGTGTPILLLHGFTGSTDSLADCAEGLAARHRVLAMDLVGHGRSDAPRPLAPYTMARCVEQVHRVLGALDARPADVLGYSMGGRVALSLLAAYPSAVRRLVLVGASAGIESGEERRARVEQDTALARRIESEPLASFVDRWMALPLFATQAPRLGQAACARAREQRLKNCPHGLANSLRGMGTGAQPALHDALGTLAAPVLFTAGDDDVKFQGIARDLAARMPCAEVSVVPDAGHAAHLENPTAFLEIAERFLAPPGLEVS